MTHEKEPHGSSGADMLLGIKKLFEKACEYTKEKYGDTEYVFVKKFDKNIEV